MKWYALRKSNILRTFFGKFL